MATIEKFEQIEAWKAARELCQLIYSLSAKGAFQRDFALRDQIRRAAISSMSNIAEGFERGTKDEFIRFLSISKGSCGEVRSELYVALDQKYITPGEFHKAFLLTAKTAGMIHGFIQYLKRSKIAGQRYRPVGEEL